MGRTQQFDTQQVISAARDVFWSRGLDGAPLTELERATGLNRSSLYHAFGSKRGLFDAAVDDYLNAVIRPRLRPLLDPDARAGSLTAYFSGFRDALLALPADSPRLGCLLLNSTAGLASPDTALSAAVQGYYDELTAAISAGLTVDAPETLAGVRRERAQTLVSLTVTAMMLARVNQQEGGALLDTAAALSAGWAADGEGPRPASGAVLPG